MSSPPVQAAVPPVMRARSTAAAAAHAWMVPMSGRAWRQALLSHRASASRACSLGGEFPARASRGQGYSRSEAAALGPRQQHRSQCVEIAEDCEAISAANHLADQRIDRTQWERRHCHRVEACVGGGRSCPRPPRRSCQRGVADEDEPSIAGFRCNSASSVWRRYVRLRSRGRRPCGAVTISGWSGRSVVRWR
jgi:hypothetical protein